MFERLQKPFLTVETGEAYQPIRLTYELLEKEKLIERLNQLKCLERKAQNNAWDWFWKEECDDLHFESIDAFKKNSTRPTRLATLTIRDGHLYINLPSFKRACLAVPFFHKLIDETITKVIVADFINKVFGLDERLPHGFSELFKEDELEKLIEKRMAEYNETQEQIEHAESADEALAILKAYNDKETKKKLPFSERYSFQHDESINAEIVFLSFYIFLRGRELVAIRRWFGETGYTLSDAADDAVEEAFGGMNIDIIE